MIKHIRTKRLTRHQGGQVRCAYPFPWGFEASSVIHHGNTKVYLFRVTLAVPSVTGKERQKLWEYLYRTCDRELPRSQRREHIKNVVKGYSHGTELFQNFFNRPTHHLRIFIEVILRGGEQFAQRQLWSFMEHTAPSGVINSCNFSFSNGFSAKWCKISKNPYLGTALMLRYRVKIVLNVTEGGR